MMVYVQITGYHEYNGLLVYRRDKIRNRYLGCSCLRKDLDDDGGSGDDRSFIGWFWVDLISCLPISYMQHLGIIEVILHFRKYV